jgi:3-oxoacyl-[acyl-carrier-protein] synthase II
VFGERLAEIPVSSVKGHIGHAFGGAGALEAVACIRALETGWLPPTLNCDDLDEGMPPDVVPHQARQQPIDTALSTSFGFGGQNGALVFRKGAVSAASE